MRSSVCLPAPCRCHVPPPCIAGTHHIKIISCFGADDGAKMLLSGRSGLNFSVWFFRLWLLFLHMCFGEGSTESSPGGPAEGVGGCGYISGWYPWGSSISSLAELRCQQVIVEQVLRLQVDKIALIGSYSSCRSSAALTLTNKSDFSSSSSPTPTHPPTAFPWPLVERWCVWDRQ